MKQIILDFRNCKNALDMHKQLSDTFDFPDYYGKNLSALWDLLSYHWYEEGNVVISIIGTEKIPKEWKPYMEKILEVFEDVHEETPNVTFKIIS